ncbi:MAG: hypothetical protein AB7H97_16520 [Pseudobdellovibrionaceae bacterium]
MNSIKWTEIFLLSVTMLFGIASFSNADESRTEKAVESTKEAGRDLKKNTKKAWRNTKDEACEMVNGKMECAGKKVKHKIQNGVDEVKDKVDMD